MSTSVHRVLALLEVLQSRDLVTAAELAERFGVDRRTIRRDVARLQQEGVPVSAVRGPHGGYRLRPGRTVPPLLLSDHEAMSVVLGLMVVDQLAVTDEADSAAALDKVRRVLPDRVRARRGAGVRHRLHRVGASTHRSGTPRDRPGPGRRGLERTRRAPALRRPRGCPHGP